MSKLENQAIELAKKFLEIETLDQDDSFEMGVVSGVEHMLEVPDTFDPEISAERYHIWCKHHQRVSELDSVKINELKKDLEWALDNWFDGLDTEKVKSIRKKHNL